MSETYTESCRLCGRPLEYAESGRELACSICGVVQRANVFCPEGHYVCEACHGGEFLTRLPDLVSAMVAAGESSPFRLAERLMDDPDLPMLGCEHAHVAAASLMASLRAAGVAGVTEAHEREALERTACQAVSAYCGLTGVCGVVPALGACYSVLVGGQCGRGPQTRASMELVSRLAAVTAAEAEPGCCKAYVRAGLLETVRTLERELGVVLPPPDPVACTHVTRHPHGCRGAACDWHPEHTTTTTKGHTMASTAPGAQARYDDFFGLAYADGALSAKEKILIALGASLASGCSP